MGRFSDALRQGLDAQARLRGAQSDIQEILKEVAEDIGALLGSSVRLAVARRTKVFEGLQTKFTEALGILPAKNEVQIWVIEANVTGRASILLAELEFSDVGYPITIRWPERFIHITDQSGIAPAIEELFRSRHAGEKLETLVNAQTKAE